MPGLFRNKLFIRALIVVGIAYLLWQNREFAVFILVAAVVAAYAVLIYLKMLERGKVPPKLAWVAPALGIDQRAINRASNPLPSSQSLANEAGFEGGSARDSATRSAPVISNPSDVRTKVSQGWDEETFFNVVSSSVFGREKIEGVAKGISKHLAFPNPQGALTIFIGGENGTGKTTLRDAIENAVGYFGAEHFTLYEARGVEQSPWSTVLEAANPSKIQVLLYDQILPSDINDDFQSIEHIQRRPEFANWLIFCFVSLGENEELAAIDQRLLDRATLAIRMDTLRPEQLASVVSLQFHTNAREVFGMKVYVPTFHQNRWIGFLSDFVDNKHIKANNLRRSDTLIRDALLKLRSSFKLEAGQTYRVIPPDGDGFFDVRDDWEKLEFVRVEQ